MATRAVSIAAIPSPLVSPRRFLRFRSIPTSVTPKCPISIVSTQPADGAFLVSALGSRRGGRKKKAAPEERELGEEDERDEEEEEGSTPFDRMRKWMRNRPTGFGEGKTYDVSLEEELMKEIERSRRAQAATLRGSSGGAVAVPQEQPQQRGKVPDVAPSGVLVRIGNLPKKRNIHRDLQSAFKVFAGINNIIPVTIANKKTRDPVCKGFAFIEFESEEVANRFVKAYSRQSLMFGKVEKQITCHVVSSSHAANSDSETSSSETTSIEWSTADTVGTCLKSDINTSIKYQEENSEGCENEVNELGIIPANSDHFPQFTSQPARISVERYDINSAKFEETAVQRDEARLASENSLVSREMQKKQGVVPKDKKKMKPRKGSKIYMPGSANRLKEKERDVLIDVFSKYGGKSIALSK